LPRLLLPNYNCSSACKCCSCWSSCDGSSRSSQKTAASSQAPAGRPSGRGSSTTITFLVIANHLCVSVVMLAAPRALSSNMKNNNGGRSLAKKEQPKHAKPTGEATARAAATGNRRQLSNYKKGNKSSTSPHGTCKNDFELAQLHVSAELFTTSKHFS